MKIPVRSSTAYTNTAYVENKKKMGSNLFPSVLIYQQGNILIVQRTPLISLCKAEQSDIAKKLFKVYAHRIKYSDCT